MNPKQKKKWIYDFLYNCLQIWLEKKIQILFYRTLRINLEKTILNAVIYQLSRRVKLFCLNENNYNKHRGESMWTIRGLTTSLLWKCFLNIIVSQINSYFEK